MYIEWTACTCSPDGTDFVPVDLTLVVIEHGDLN